MDIIMDIKGYLFMICKDIFFHARYSRGTIMLLYLLIVIPDTDGYMV
jgi:hypothetical protein